MIFEIFYADIFLFVISTAVSGLVSATSCPPANEVLSYSTWLEGELPVPPFVSHPPLKILVLSEPSPITYMSGQSARFRTLLQHLVEEYPDDQIHLVTAETRNERANPRPTSCFHGKIPIHYTWGFRLPQYNALTLSLDFSAKVWRLCRKEKFDVMHVSSPGNLIWPAILVSRLQGIPLLMSYHTHLPVYVRTYLPAPWNILLEWITWRLLQFSHSLADLTVVTSPQIAEDFAAHGIRNVRVWPKGVDTSRFNHQYECQEMRHHMSDGNPNELLIVYIGRLAKEKRLTDLKGILEHLQQTECRQTRLCVVGDGPEAKELRAYFEGTSTTFLGSLEGVELSQAFASGDVFVMPSDSETLGFVVMESMASGVPVVASDAGGLKDLILHGATGYLVPPGNTKEFANRILELNTDRALRIEIIQAARAATEQWSWYASMEFLRIQAYPLALQNYSLRLYQKVGRWIHRPLTNSEL